MHIEVIREEEASGEVGQIFRDVRETLGIPFMSSFFRALGAHPQYLTLAWSQVKPLIRTAAFEGAAEGIRARAEAAARSFKISDHPAALRERDMADDEISRLKQMIDMFHRAYPRVFLIATALKESMKEQPVGTPSAGAEAERSSLVEVPRAQLSSQALECEVDGRVRPILEDIRRRLDLPFVNSVYTSIACWPDYLELAWSDVREITGTEEYVDRLAELEVMANAGMADLPHPVKADPSALHAQGVGEGEIKEIRGLLDVFVWMLAGVVVNVAVFRQGLRGGTGHLHRK